MPKRFTPVPFAVVLALFTVGSGAGAPASGLQAQVAIPALTPAQRLETVAVDSDGVQAIAQMKALGRATMGQRATQPRSTGTGGGREASGSGDPAARAAPAGSVDRAALLDLLDATAGAQAGRLRPGTTGHAPGQAGSPAVDAAWRPDRLAGDATTEVTCPPLPLPIGSDVDGVLGDSGCHVPQLIDSDNPSLADQYVVTLEERGRLTISVPMGEFKPYIALVDDLYFPIAESTSSGAAARVAVVLPAGTYVLVVAAAPDTPDGQGVYQITSQFEVEPAPAGCLSPTPLVLDTQVTGSLAPGDCRLFDVLNDVFRDSFIALYEVEVPRNGSLDLAYTPAGYAGFLAVLDPDLNAALAATEPSGGPVEATAHLAPGTYWILVSSRLAATGDFSLSASFTASDAPCVPEAVALDATVDGKLESSDCRMPFLPGGGYDQATVDLYQVVVPQTGLYRINVLADDFQPSLRILKWSYAPAVAPMTGLAGSTSLSRTVSFIPGIFVLAVSWTGDAPRLGGYRLELEFQADGDPCSVNTLLGPSGTVSGELALTDCTLADVYVNSSQDRADVYRFKATQRGLLKAEMTGSVADPFLAVLNAGSTMVAYGTQPGGIELDMALAPGDYTLVASSLGARPQSGSYQVKLTFTPEPQPAGCPLQALQPSATVNGSLGAGDCRVFDVLPASATDKVMDRFSLKLAQRGTLQLRMNSTAVDAWVEIFAADTYTSIAYNDDRNAAANDFNAELEVLLPPGDYIVHATTPIFANSGAYRLISAFTPVPVVQPCPVADLAVDGRHDGDLSETADCRMLDLPGGGFRTSAVDVYRLHVPQNGLMEIEYRALGLDPELTLYDLRWNELAYNANISDVNLDARLELRIPSGIYRVVASNEIDSFGDYVLSTTFEPNPWEAPPTATPTATTRVSPTPSATRAATPTRTPTGPGPRPAIYVPLVAKQFVLPRP